jgi:esterase/lipase superfamily enzyme
MLFITNRAIRQSRRSRIGRGISFAKVNVAEQSVFFCRREGKEEYTEVGSKNFFKELKESDYKQILIYIHGYSNLPEENVFPTVNALQALFDAKEPGLVQVVPLVWPCDDDYGVVVDYYDDQQAADASSFAFARVLEKLLSWQLGQENEEDPCMKRINVLAHSMGNRVFRGAIKAWGKYHRAYRLPLLFRNAFLVAADVVNESLEGLDGGLLCECIRNVSVYYASDDLALRASKVANLRNKVASRRMGHTGPENMSKVPKNVYAIDCDDINVRYDPPLGHSYFSYDETRREAGVVFNHIYYAINVGRVMVSAPGAKTMRLETGTVIEI